jgi:hypothetical protein
MMHRFMTAKAKRLVIAAIAVLAVVVAAAATRMAGNDWDEGTHLHPDERFLTMVAGAMHWPVSFSQYLDTDFSPLNPHNIGYGFYVYGTWPVILVKAVADAAGKADYRTIPLIGRMVSAGVDLATLIGVGLIAYAVSRSLVRSRRILFRTVILAMLLYATAVLPIQLTHYFTVDPYLVACITWATALSLLLLSAERTRVVVLLSVAIGILTGAGVAAKIQGALFTPLPLAVIVLRFLINRSFRQAADAAAVMAVCGAVTLRLLLPYLFAGHALVPTALNPKTLENWKTLKYEYDWKTYKDTKSVYFPPATMFLSTKNYLFPLENILLWGSGIPLALLTLGGYLLAGLTAARRFRSKATWPLILLAGWSIGVFLYQGQEFAKYLRYFYILYPAFAVLAGLALERLTRNRPGTVVGVVLLTAHILYTLSFLSIYRTENPRAAASRWIFANIPPGAVLATEYWDDGLPLCLDGYPCPSPYKFVDLPFYDSESPEKWTKISEKLRESEYIILSSNRLYGSISAVPDRYPQTGQFYRALFAGRLGYTKIAEFTSRPNLPIPGIRLCITPPGIWYGAVAAPGQRCDRTGVSLVDDYADESFTVYDHPKVIIFRKDIP